MTDRPMARVYGAIGRHVGVLLMCDDNADDVCDVERWSVEKRTCNYVTLWLCHHRTRAHAKEKRRRRRR